jgi:putative ubiquitin-RnfH superfamily antitoxin RatB of RatAB toxin-antitoxin module
MMGTIAVSVAYATPEVQELVEVEVPAGASARIAVERSGLVAAYALDLATLGVAIHGRRRSLDTTLDDGDRVELTRPLVADPKDVRRKRALARKSRDPR